MIKKLTADESGQTLGEYAILAGLVGIVVIVAVTLLGSSSRSIINNIATQLAK